MMTMDNSQNTIRLPLSAIGALALGQKIQAIKIVRAETSLDIKAAKALVDAYEKEHPDICPDHLVSTGHEALIWLLLIAVMFVLGFAALFYLTGNSL